MLRPILELGEVFSQPLGDRALNRQMRGWANYFSRGYPRGAYWELDWYLRWRFMRHLRRRGQRRFRPPKDEPWYSFFQRQGLLELNRSH